LAQAASVTHSGQATEFCSSDGFAWNGGSLDSLGHGGLNA